jgi:hypothetical protein
MLRSAPNVTIIFDFIDHEIDRLFANFPTEVREQFSSSTKLFFRGEQSFDDTQQLFFRNCAGDLLLRKVQDILKVTDSPLPPPSAQRIASAGTRRKSYPWNDSEDLRLLVAVARYGAKDWRSIASFVGSGRTSSQCNQRWCRALDPAIIHKPWTETDDKRLLRAVEVLGKTSWCQIAKIMCGRTDLQCRYRYLQIAKESESEKVAAEPNLEEVAKKRRNSISIASFTSDAEIEKIMARPPSSIQLPHFLESSFRPRDDQNPKYLHRLPPLLFPRCKKKPDS